jgi:hypothetical protein
MSEKFMDQIDGLLEKYSELLIGKTDEELKKKVQAWALYSFIAKSMPPLVQHWNASYPDAKEEMKQIIAEIKKLNEENKAANKKD